MLSVASVQNKEESIPARLCQQFSPFSLELPIEQNRCLRGVPVVRIVWRNLIAPGEHSRVHVQRYDRTGPQIVALAPGSCVYRIRIANAPVDQSQIRIVRAGHPRHPATMASRVRVGPALRAGFAWV